MHKKLVSYRLGYEDVSTIEDIAKKLKWTGTDVIREGIRLAKEMYLDKKKKVSE